CQREDGSDDPSKGTYSMEAYALEIQMYADTRNNKRLKGLYNRAIGVRSAVPHPKIMGIIRECGGKMFMSEENWKAAQSAFFESFRSYDEAGSMQRIQVLKYLVLTTMLMGSDINPFDSQETKPYKNDPRIVAMTELVDAYQRDDITQYEKVLKQNQDLLADPFIAENIDEVTRNMRTKAVVKLVAPYTRFRLDFIAKRLSISIAEVQDIVGFLIMDKKLRGKINQDAGTVEIESRADQDRMTAVADWTTAIRSLANFVLNEGDGFKSDDAMGGLGGSGLVAPPMPGGGSSMSSLQRGTNTGKRKSNRGAVAGK
ncbi:COP9 signalosome complex subunit, partial [Hortaea werneckii]